MKFFAVRLGLVLALVVLASLSPSSAVQITRAGEGPAFSSIGPLAFAPDGTLFAADTQGAAIVALDLGAHAGGGAAGAKGLDAIDQKLAALLGTGASEVVITDLAVHPKTRNAYVSVMRGQGAGAARGALPRRRRWSDCQRAAADPEVPAGRNSERASGESRGADQSPHTGRHRHGVCGRPSLGGRPVE